MNKKEFREHCEKQIERCIKLNDSKHLKEHELALGLLNENERLIQQKNKYKEVIEKLKDAIEECWYMDSENIGDQVFLKKIELQDILKEAE